MFVDQQWHGYRRGHQLIASTVELDPRDQDLVDKLSDASGSPRPGERFNPYITVYPLPSGRFHVVARTWQDLDAPRSGTVLTRSLLVPGEVWRSLDDVGALFSALHDNAITDEPANISSLRKAWTPLGDPKLVELTEALFLERSVAVACFGFDNAETIAGRLLQSFWPSRRSTFALCTYALGPRTLSDRDFDLVFAPDSAKPRFAKWEGRKISASTAPTAARHAWTENIVKRVFWDARPELEDLDELGVFGSSSKADASALRLALLWSDLKESAPSSPKSLLGMLDVLRSLGRRPWDLTYFPGLLSRSLSIAVDSPTEETWQFLNVLVRKLGKQVPLDVVRAIFVAAGNLARSSPDLVASDTEDPLQAMPHLLRPAVARGLSSISAEQLTEFLQSTNTSLTLALMAENPSFAELVTKSLALGSDTHLINSLSYHAQEDPRSAKRIALNVARGAVTAKVKPLLQVSLENAPKGNFGLIAKSVLSNGGMRRAELLNVLVDTASAFSAQETLRQIALNAPNQDEGDALLLGLVHDRADVTWLIENLASHPERLHSILLKMIARGSDSHLREVINAGRNKDAFLAAVLSGLPSTASELLRVLKLVQASASTTVGILRRASEQLPDRDIVDVASTVLDHVFSVEPSSIQDLLRPLLALGDAGRIVTAATSTALPSKQVGANVAAIAKSPSAPRFVPRVDLITAKLVERRAGGFGKEGYDGWAVLLRRARQGAAEALVRSADAALDYCLSRRNEPAGSVVAATFPIVHARLSKKSNLPDIPHNLFTAMVYASISMFTDWDRAKEARQGVVDAFLKSNWEPAELLLAGVDAKIPDKILGYLVSRSGGRDYLRKIEKSVSSSPTATQKALKAALAEFRSER